MYLVFSLKNAAWLSEVGNYTSDRTKAMTMTREQAIEICTQHMLMGKLTSIPVSKDDLNAIG